MLIVRGQASLDVADLLGNLHFHPIQGIRQIVIMQDKSLDRYGRFRSLLRQLLDLSKPSAPKLTLVQAEPLTDHTRAVVKGHYFLTCLLF